MRSLSLTVSPPLPEPLKIIFDVTLPAVLLFCITKSLSDAEAPISCLVVPAPLKVNDDPLSFISSTPLPL